MGTHHERLVENQQIFRLANERLDEQVRALNMDGSPVPFLCECADDACLGRVELTHGQYAEVRTADNRYVILPGHAMVDGEQIMKDNGDHLLVEKSRG